MFLKKPSKLPHPHSMLYDQGIDDPELARAIASDLDLNKMIVPAVDFNDKKNHDKAVTLASLAIFFSEPNAAAVNVVNNLSLAGLITPDEYSSDEH